MGGETIGKAVIEIPSTEKMIRNCCLVIIVCICVLSFLVVILIIVSIRLRYSQYPDMKRANKLENNQEKIEGVHHSTLATPQKFLKQENARPQFKKCREATPPSVRHPTFP